MKILKKMTTLLAVGTMLFTWSTGVLPESVREKLEIEVRAAGDIIASGECGADGDNLTWTLDDEGMLIISGQGAMRDYSVYGSNPSKWDSMVVTSVVIEEDVTSIGNAAFEYHENLTTVSISDDVTNIGDYAFLNCTALTDIVLSENLLSIGYEAFNRCTNMERILLPDSVSSIGKGAFAGCTNLSDVNIPKSLGSIPSNCFPSTNISEISIPENITAIGDQAFLDTPLTEIVIPDSVKTVGAGAFHICPYLTKVVVSSEIIDNTAFCSCHSLTTVYVDKSVSQICATAFFDSNAITDVYYAGSEEEWNSIAIYGGDEISGITNANVTIHYNSIMPVTTTEMNTYQVFDLGNITWDAAVAYCESLGGHMATITSQEENDYVYQLITSQGYENVYFGLTDTVEEGNWVWIDGNTSSYRNWSPGEPNSSSEDYAMFYYEFTDGTWNNGHFSNGDTAFICEWENGNLNIPEESDSEVQTHIEFYNENQSNFLTSNNALFRDLKNEAENDEGAVWYKLLKDLDSVFELDDAYHQEMTVQTIMVELLCSEESVDNAYTSFLNAGEAGTDKILDAVAYNPDGIIEVTNNYDVQGELEKVLAIKDRSSSEFLNAKKAWFENSIDSLNLEKLKTAMKALGYVADLTNMAFEDAREFYNFYATSESYKAADQYMRDALNVLNVQMIVIMAESESISASDMRAVAVAQEFVKQYEKMADTSDEKYYEYAMELIKEDGLKFGEKAAKKSMVFILEKCVEVNFPQVAAALKVAGVTLDIGIQLFEAITGIDDRVLERDLYLNLLVFQNAATATVHHLGDELVENQNMDSVKIFEYGFDFYKKILRMTADHGIKYCTLKEADRSNIVYLHIESSAMNLWECHGDSTDLDEIKAALTETFYEGFIYLFSCPVNVSILQNDILIAEMTEDGILYYAENTPAFLKLLYTTDDEYATKLLIIPFDYNVEVTGFATGTMSFEKATIENGGVTTISTITDIPVQNGSAYTEVIEDGVTVALEYDQENDGITDQTLTAEVTNVVTVGDLNSDGEINASDAAAILTAAAAVGSGGESGLTAAQEAAADVNGDSEFNASDAAIVLQYAAAVGSGYTGTLDEFMAA